MIDAAIQHTPPIGSALLVSWASVGVGTTQGVVQQLQKRSSEPAVARLLSEFGKSLGPFGEDAKVEAPDLKVGDRVEIRSQNRRGGDFDDERGEVLEVGSQFVHVRLDGRGPMSFSSGSVYRLNAIDRLGELADG